MKVLVLGAGGKTGSAVVEKATAAGHEVTAFVQDPDSYQTPPGVQVVAGDATDRGSVGAAIAGHAAVIDTIGGKTPYKKGVSLERDAAVAVIGGMREHGTRRLVVTSMIGEGDSDANATTFERLLLKTMMRGTTPDKAAMEDDVETSGLDWVIVRPAILNDDPPTGNVTVYDPSTGDKAHKITRGDLAAFLVDQLAADTHVGRAVTIANS